MRPQATWKARRFWSAAAGCFCWRELARATIVLAPHANKLAWQKRQQAAALQNAPCAPASRCRFPHDRTVESFPPINEGLVAAFDGGSLDFERRRDQFIADRPRPIDDGNEVQPFVRIELRVHFFHLRAQRLFQGFSLIRTHAAPSCVRRQYDDGERAGKAGAHDAAGLNRRMRQQLALDRSRRHMLTFAGLELLLDAADDLHLTVGIEADQIAGAKKSIRRQRSCVSWGSL